MKKKAFVAITGASGTIYGFALVKALLKADIETHVCLTEEAVENAQAETGEEYKNIEEIFEKQNISNIVLYNEKERGAAPASGSFRMDYYIIAPASMGFVGRAAGGVSSNLPERCAEVALKERKPLAILFRETPLSSIDLENLLRLSRAGAIIMPASPAFYHRPEKIDDLVDFTVGKVLDIIGVEHRLFKRWS